MPVTFPHASRFTVQGFRDALATREVKASTEVRHTGDAKADTLRTKDASKTGWRIFDSFRAHRRMAFEVMAQQVGQALMADRRLGERMVRELVLVPSDPKFDRGLLAGHWTIAAALTDLVGQMHTDTGLALDRCLSLCIEACKHDGAQLDPHNPATYVHWLGGQREAVMARARAEQAGPASPGPTAAAAQLPQQAPGGSTPRPSPSSSHSAVPLATPDGEDPAAESLFGDADQSSNRAGFATPATASSLDPGRKADGRLDNKQHPASPLTPDGGDTDRVNVHLPRRRFPGNRLGEMAPRQLELDASPDKPGTPGAASPAGQLRAPDQALSPTRAELWVGQTARALVQGRAGALSIATHHVPSVPSLLKALGALAREWPAYGMRPGPGPAGSKDVEWGRLAQFIGLAPMTTGQRGALCSPKDLLPLPLAFKASLLQAACAQLESVDPQRQASPSTAQANARLVVAMLAQVFSREEVLRPDGREALERAVVALEAANLGEAHLAACGLPPASVRSLRSDMVDRVLRRAQADAATKPE